MKEWLVWAEHWFREQRDVSACLVLSTLPLPLFFLFLLLPVLAMSQSQASEIYNWNLVMFTQVVLLMVCCVLGAIAAFCWPRRDCSENYPLLSILTVTVALAGTLTVSLSYGYKDTPLMLLCMGMLLAVRSLFKANVYKPAFIVIVTIFLINEAAFWLNAYSYAPLLQTPVYVGEQLTSWWAVWLRVIYIMISVPTVALFMLLGYFMRTERLALQKMVITDGLTDVANRSHFIQRLETEGRRHHRNGSSLCVLMCDVDHFKQINDTWGHGAGDDVLRAIGKILRQITRSDSDVVARFGGEEFVVLLPHTQIVQATKLAEKIRQHLSHHIFGSGENSFHVTMSIGVAQVDDGDGEKAVKLADDALYQAKSAGRDRVIAQSHPVRSSSSSGLVEI